MKFQIDGAEVHASEGDTVMQAARNAGIFIPGLCYSERAQGSNCCRLCMVEATENGRHKLVAACAFQAKEGLLVDTTTKRVTRIRKTILKLMYAQAPENPVIMDLMGRYGVTPEKRLQEKNEQCILCGACVSACNSMGINAISTVNRGIDKRVDTPYGKAASGCIGCASCAELCPTKCIEAADDQQGRTIWNKEFQWIHCESCGAVITTGSHWQSSNPEDAPVLCKTCKRKSMTDVLAGTYGE